MKKISLFVFFAVLLFACEQVENVGSESLGKTQKISFKLGLPQGDPIVYTKAIHDAAEYKITKLYLYEYDVEGTNKTKLLRREDVSAQLNGQAGPEYEMELDVETADKGIRMFAFVANDEITVPVGSAFEELESQILSKQLNDEYKITGDLSMSGLARQGNSSLIAITGHDIACDVEMQRVVARIDVRNNAPGLVISSVKLKGVPNQATIFAQNDHSAPSTATVVSHKTFVAPTNVAEQKNMKKVCYLYECKVTSETDSPKVIVEGTFKNVKVGYTIPFISKGAPIQVLRNHLYTIILGDGNVPPIDGSLLNFSIITEEWNEITMNEVFGIITATYNGGNATLSNDDKHHLFTMKDNSSHNEELTLATEFTEHTAFSATVTQGSSWITATISGESLQLTIQSNNTGAERTALIDIFSDADSATIYQLKLVQPK